MEKFKAWAKAAGIRALKTVAQTTLATMGTTATLLSDINWAVVASSAILAGTYSILMSAAGLPEVNDK